MRIEITKLPLDKAAYGKQVQGSLSLNPKSMGDDNYNSSMTKSYNGVKQSVAEVPREEANLEAEGGETAFGPITGQSIPDHLKIIGKRHYQGGVPLNLPDDTFIFSDTASLRINDPNILAMFNKAPKKGGYTPAEIAKPYNINKYKAILLDPDTSKLERDTAIIMIKNYIMKLGSLALVQESMKGFPQGIPEMAKPYMEANGITEEDLMPELKEQSDLLAQTVEQGSSMDTEQNPMAAQEMQQMNPQQAMEGDQAMLDEAQEAPSYPEQMPSGAPVASPEMMQQMVGQGSMPPPNMMQEPDMMEYGGMPYAMYGMQMGGYDFPYEPTEMEYGGVPKFQGLGNSQVTVNGIAAERRNESPAQGSGYQPGTVAGAGPNAQGYYRIQAGAERNANENVITNRGNSRNYNEGRHLKALCDEIKAGSTVDNILKRHYSSQEQYRAFVESKFADCFKEADAKFADKKDAFYNEQCPCKDEQGNVIEGMFAEQDENGDCLPETCVKETEKLICRCTDPVTGKVKEFPIEKDEECICQDGSRGQSTTSNLNTPHLSKRARLDIARNALMKTGVARDNVVLPGSAGISGAYEEYQTKVDTAQSAVNSLQNAVMYGTSGSTGTKQAQMKDLLGKSLRASMDDVANVQSRNADRQRETNVLQANIDNNNIAARATGLGAALSSQAGSQNLETVNKNKRLYGTTGALMQGLSDMAKLQQINTVTPQYAADYENEFILPTGVEKPLTGVSGQTFEDRIAHYTKKTGDYNKAFDMAYKEARLNNTKKYGGQRKANGGYVLANTAYPF